MNRSIECLVNPHPPYLFPERVAVLIFETRNDVFQASDLHLVLRLDLFDLEIEHDGLFARLGQLVLGHRPRRLRLRRLHHGQLQLRPYIITGGKDGEMKK